MTLRLIMTLPLALLFGCAPGLGELCFEDSDCKTGLHCSATGGRRGVCTYPEGVPDLTVKADRARDMARDMARPDATLPDQGIDAIPDQGIDAIPDQAAPDQVVPDLPLPDATAPDAGTQDALQADAPGTDL